MNHCGKPECSAAQELREALAEEKIPERRYDRAMREAATLEKLLCQILRVPS